MIQYFKKTCFSNHGKFLLNYIYIYIKHVLARESFGKHIIFPTQLYLNNFFGEK
jgi:hypothetical protein